MEDSVERLLKVLGQAVDLNILKSWHVKLKQNWGGQEEETIILETLGNAIKWKTLWCYLIIS